MNVRWIGATAVSGSFLLLTGCALFDNADQYVSPVAAQVLLVGIVNPFEGQVQIQDQVAATVFVADARQISSLDRITDAPVTGAEVSLGVGEDSLSLNEAESGLYYDVSYNGEGLSYQAGATYRAQMTIDGERYAFPAEAPEPTGFEEDRTCVVAAAATTLNLTGGPFERVLATVFDSQGNQTWSNVPETSSEFVDFLTADDASDTLELPAAAFPDADALYGVALAGINRSEGEPETLNVLLSRFFIGAGRVGLIGTYTDEAACAELQAVEEE